MNTEVLNGERLEEEKNKGKSETSEQRGMKVKKTFPRDEMFVPENVYENMEQDEVIKVYPKNLLEERKDQDGSV